MNTNNLIISKSEVETYTVTIGVKLGIPLGRLRPYGFLGIGVWNADYEETATNVSSGLQAARINSDIVESGLKFGGGLEFALTPSISIYGEVQYLKGLGDLDGINYLLATAGIVLRL